MEGGACKLKNLLIITPHFPPVNSADMHRVRQSLPYYKEFGWNPVIITVDPKYIESYSIDPLLSLTIPPDIRVYKVGALPVKTTRKFGLGSLSMRAYFQVQKKGNELLKNEHFDLVFFSTTAFHVMALGPGWKKKFGVPFVLDMQDPWRNDFFLSKPKSERPPKFFISHNIDKRLEAKTVPKADGIISVSQAYCDTFKDRYSGLTDRNFKVIPFGASEYDFEIMRKYVKNTTVQLPADRTNLVYIGAATPAFRFALEILFRAFKKGLSTDSRIFSKCHFSFIGTSYAKPGQGKKTIEPLASELEIEEFVTEITDRISYFDTLFLLQKADLLIVPGSTDTTYTASKIYPYVLAEKPLLAIFHKNSSVVKVLHEIRDESIVGFDNDSSMEEVVDECFSKLKSMLENLHGENKLNKAALTPYLATTRTKEQVDFFDQVVENYRARQS